MSERNHEQEHRDNMWAKISHLETETAGIKSDIRGLYAGLDEIRDVLVRMQDNTRPNIGGLILGALAICSFLVTIGGLTVTPIWRALGDADAEFSRIESKVNSVDRRLSDRIYRDENLLLEGIRRQARIEGAMGIFSD